MFYNLNLSVINYLKSGCHTLSLPLLYSTLLLDYSTLPYSTSSTLLYSTLLYSTLLYSTLLYPLAAWLSDKCRPRPVVTGGIAVMAIARSGELTYLFREDLNFVHVYIFVIPSSVVLEYHIRSTTT